MRTESTLKLVITAPHADRFKPGVSRSLQREFRQPHVASEAAPNRPARWHRALASGTLGGVSFWKSSHRETVPIMQESVKRERSANSEWLSSSLIG
ncbi:hypothetical protein DPMN_075952 [Dreissena polymorpha]|uniref:Uncharacterized protein n=1 Tax=Dreissena polymorpha TaxID=45954 RepID=A0A9D3YLE7_DREPO|nr:hypothetical protein DPMN_075952 [Dreissena polymorpha]